MNMKRLPLSDRSFLDIIKGDYVYADKTEYIHNLLKSDGNQFFLSRPRRFGKTLLLDTIEALFTGNKESFKDLWIGRSNYEFRPYPVIRVSLGGNSNTSEDLITSLLRELVTNAEDANLDIFDKNPDSFFQRLIRGLSKKYNSKVVVLIDEYDSPVAGNIHNMNVALENATILRYFFGMLKNSHVLSRLHFALVTGITRFALTSPDSGANHFLDISMDPKYTGICGFTTEELETLFSDRMEHTLSTLKENDKFDYSANVNDLKDHIYYWYDGYDWSGQTKTRVLNPYSILNFFDKGYFSNFWIQRGRPSHLTSMIRKDLASFVELNLESYPAAQLTKSDLDSLEPVPVLFHTGYLTIDKTHEKSVKLPHSDSASGMTYHTLKFPNFEISSSFYTDCFQVVFGDKITQVVLDKKAAILKDAFLNENSDVVSSIFMDLFGAGSHHQRPEGEKTFRVMVRVALLVMGFNVHTELPGHKGRLDPCVALPDGVHVMIELRYRREIQNKLTIFEENEILAGLVENHVTKFKFLECLAEVSRNHAKLAPFREIIEAKGRSDGLEPEDIDALVSDAILNALSPAERIETLAALVRRETRVNELNKELIKLTSSKTPLTDERIDESLTALANEALRDMVAKDCQSVVKDKATKIIILGMAIYGDGSKIKSVFGNNDKP